MLWVLVKSLGMNHPRVGFREQGLLYCMWITTYTVEACRLWLVSSHLWLDRERSYYQGLNVEETHNRRHGECRLISRTVTDSCTSEFSALTSGNTQKHDVLSFLLRSVVYQVGWPLGHAYIFSYIPISKYISLKTKNSQKNIKKATSYWLGAQCIRDHYSYKFICTKYRCFRIHCSSFWEHQENGVPWFSFASAVCQVGWPSGHACIFS